MEAEHARLIAKMQMMSDPIAQAHRELQVEHAVMNASFDNLVAKNRDLWDKVYVLQYRLDAKEKDINLLKEKNSKLEDRTAKLEDCTTKLEAAVAELKKGQEMDPFRPQTEYSI